MLFCQTSQVGAGGSVDDSLEVHSAKAWASGSEMMGYLECINHGGDSGRYLALCC